MLYIDLFQVLAVVDGRLQEGRLDTLFLDEVKDPEPRDGPDLWRKDRELVVGEIEGF